jgi:HAMP domain-containing protein
VKLWVKFNLILLSVFSAGLLVTGLLSYRVLQKNAREEVLQNAQIMIDSAKGAAAYTVAEVRPLLMPDMKRRFVPQGVSFYAARQSFELLRTNQPEYTYRLASLNPTNPSNHAFDWEADIIREFRNNPDRKQIIIERNTPTGRVLSLFQPVTVSDQGCLACHNRPQDAPKNLVETYGASNGFGWQLHDTVAAQAVSVPMSVPVQRAHETFVTLMALLVGIFVVLFVLLNLLLHFVIVRPVVRMSRLATDVSLGKPDVPEFAVSGSDEIAALSASFNRMRRSFEGALKMLPET